MFEMLLDCKLMKITIRVISHFRPHLDEITAACLASWFGNMDFVKRFCKDMTLELGIGIGIFNEHHQEGREDQKEKINKILLEIYGDKVDLISNIDEECRATIMARVLGIYKAPRLKRLLNFVRNNDNKGIKQKNDIAHLFKVMNELWPSEQEENVEWLIEAIVLKLKKDNQNGDFTIERIMQVKKTERVRFSFFTAKEWIGRAEKAQEENQSAFERAVEELNGLVKTRQAKTRRFFLEKTFVKIVAFQSDKTRSMSAARWHKGQNADVIIKKNSRGQAAIWVNRKKGLKIQEVAGVVRLAEQEKEGVVIINDWQQLRQNGSIGGDDKLFLYVETDSLLNGSLTHPDVDPLLLSLDELMFLVWIALDPKAFYPSEAFNPFSMEECSFCISSCKEPCPFYRYGLPQCRTVRFKQKQNKAA